MIKRICEEHAKPSIKNEQGEYAQEASPTTRRASIEAIKHRNARKLRGQTQVSFKNKCKN